MSKGLELLGMKFNRLTVIDQVRLENQQQRHWLCRCDCGTEKVVGAKELTKGSIKSCGCYNTEVRSILTTKRNTTHGQAKTPLYNLWRGIRNRCELKTHKRYADYGGRGISVCDRWHDFLKFKEDMGEKPKGLSLERIDNDGDYTPENCKWGTVLEQNHNKRNNVMCRLSTSEICCLAEASKLLHIDSSTLSKYLNEYGHYYDLAFNDSVTYTEIPAFSLRHPNSAKIKLPTGEVTGIPYAAHLLGESVSTLKKYLKQSPEYLGVSYV